MYPKILTLLLGALLLTIIPGSSELVQAQPGQIIKIAMLAPRNSVAHIGFLKMGERIAKQTNNAWQVRVYPSGVAGDDADVLRKMKISQLDGAMVTTEGLSALEPQVAIFDAPGLIETYPQLEAAQKDLEGHFEQLLLKKGIKVLAWWELGRYRIFSKGKIEHPSDLKRNREWLLPQSYVLKEMWKEAGATGVPLGTPDVFGALQTRMIDTVLATPIVLVSMRWHTAFDHIRERASGVLLMEWIINKAKWDAIPDNVQSYILKELPLTRERVTREAREVDEDAYRRLLGRGYTAVKDTPQTKKEWDEFYVRVNRRLTGRVWPQSLYDRVRTVVAKKQ
jgi:TRAP-type transport system periplasmic protein